MLVANSLLHYCYYLMHDPLMVCDRILDVYDQLQEHGLTFETVVSRRLGDDRGVLVDDPEGVSHTLQSGDGQLVGCRVTGVDHLERK